jgi:hypothetical protein
VCGDAEFDSERNHTFFRKPDRTRHTQSQQTLLFGLAFNLYRLWLSARMFHQQRMPTELDRV